jgi:hypothetical protein
LSRFGNHLTRERTATEKIERSLREREREKEKERHTHKLYLPWYYFKTHTRTHLEKVKKKVSEEEEEDEDFSDCSLEIFIKRSAISLASNSLHISSIKNFFLRSLSPLIRQTDTQRGRERDS